ncbi:hypothetical protein A9Q77_09205 [Marinomonas sp. 42_23_T18]|nr:hypothetical protein A9Q77_09205 [Marinomonas sp. 42_23_T18]
MRTKEITKSRFKSLLNQDCLLGFLARERVVLRLGLLDLDAFFDLLAVVEGFLEGRFTGGVLLMDMSIKTAYLGCNHVARISLN